MKKKCFALGVVVLCLSLLAGSTWAYFSAEGRAHNVITSGSIGIQIIEKTRSQDGTKLEDFPADGMKNIMPGSVVSKIVSVANTGTGEAWIRVKVEPSILAKDQTPLPLTIQGSDGPVDVMRYAVKSDWVDGGDGYFYHKTPVAPGENTALLLDQVTFALEMGNAYQNSTAQLTIVAQAVQTANNPKPESGKLSDIPGWPEA